MVAQDAFSMALTNPLISEHTFNAQTFSELGMDVIAKTNRLQQVLDRNLMGDTNSYKVTMTLDTYK
jgi:prostaglandin-endoperoxide synthase 2